MTSRVVSLRLPKALTVALERSAAQAKLSRSGGLDLLLRCSVGNGELLARLKDSPDLWDAKLDARECFFGTQLGNTGKVSDAKSF